MGLWFWYFGDGGAAVGENALIYYEGQAAGRGGLEGLAGIVAIRFGGPRRSRLGELAQWDTSVHDWLAGRGEKLYLVAMIDDATSRLFVSVRANHLFQERIW